MNIDIKTLFPKGSQDFYDVNERPDTRPDPKDCVQVNVERKQPYGETINNGKLPHPKPKSTLRNESVGEAERKASDTKRCIVRITSFRCRLTDPDNLCPKYFIDALRYASAIPDDTLADIELQIRQKKVAHRSQEKTLIELES